MRKEGYLILLGQNYRNLRFFQDEGDTFAGICRIQRHIGTAGFEDAQQPHYYFQRALHADSHQYIRPHAQIDQATGKLVGTPVELSVSQSLILKDQSRSIGGSLHLFLKQFVDAFSTGMIQLCGIPFNQQLLTRSFGQYGFLGNICIQILWIIFRFLHNAIAL